MQATKVQFCRLPNVMLKVHMTQNVRIPKNGIRIARSKYHVTLSVTSRWCHKHSMQFEHSILLLLLSFPRDRNRLIPRYSCLLSPSTSLFSSETPQCQQISRVWHQRDVTSIMNSDQSPDHL